MYICLLCSFIETHFDCFKSGTVPTNYWRLRQTQTRHSCFHLTVNYPAHRRNDRRHLCLCFRWKDETDIKDKETHSQWMFAKAFRHPGGFPWPKSRHQNHSQITSRLPWLFCKNLSPRQVARQPEKGTRNQQMSKLYTTLAAARKCHTQVPFRIQFPCRDSDSKHFSLNISLRSGLLIFAALVAAIWCQKQWWSFSKGHKILSVQDTSPNSLSFQSLLRLPMP